MLTETIPQLKTLSLEEKQRLIDELIDEVYGEEVADPELAAALNARLEYFRKHPDSARSWEEVEARLRGPK